VIVFGLAVVAFRKKIRAWIRSVMTSVAGG
jgi:hypothetical protein